MAALLSRPRHNERQSGFAHFQSINAVNAVSDADIGMCLRVQEGLTCVHHLASGPGSPQTTACLDAIRVLAPDLPLDLTDNVRAMSGLCGVSLC